MLNEDVHVSRYGDDAGWILAAMSTCLDHDDNSWPTKDCRFVPTYPLRCAFGTFTAFQDRKRRSVMDNICESHNNGGTFGCYLHAAFWAVWHKSSAPHRQDLCISLCIFAPHGALPGTSWGSMHAT